MSTFIYSSLLAKKFLSMCLARPGLQLKKKKKYSLFICLRNRERGLVLPKISHLEPVLETLKVITSLM